MILDEYSNKCGWVKLIQRRNFFLVGRPYYVVVAKAKYNNEFGKNVIYKGNAEKAASTFNIVKELLKREP